MTALWIILGIIAALIVYTLIKAAFWKSKPVENAEKQEPERVDFDRYCKNLSDAIKIKTISNYDTSLVDWNEFDKFHKFLEERYPLIHKTMTKTKIGDIRASQRYCRRRRACSRPFDYVLRYGDFPH